jgi:NADH-quinone oxidoreductase subunit L
VTSTSTSVVLIILLPFGSAVAGLALGRRRILAQRIAVAGTALALVLAVVTGWRVWGSEPEFMIWGAIPTGWVPIEITTRADSLGLTLAVMVTAVALAVQIYSTAYLRRDPRYGSYAALVSLFTAAMLLVVLADDLIVLLVGWEIMGICSALLIGHHWELAEARRAAVKAFVVTHLGDAGLLVGFLVLADQAGSFRLSTIVEAVPPSTMLTVGLVFVLCGVAGKSAQVPLHVWLPDAMVGPTPISALIHAATMVAGGVFLVARLFDVYLLAPAALAVLAVMAAVTMVFAALCALAQDDLKRVLAWSTTSQLAYMLGGLAVGGYSAGLFHLVSHAAFKALLFLGAGAIAHAIGTTLLSRMTGLRASMRRTYLLMTIGLAALVGVPPLSGFFSKESVLSAAEQAALHGGPLPAWAAWLVLIAGLLTVLVTAAYATRAWLLAFHGPPPAESGHEPPPAMRLPLYGLAAATVGIALLALVLPGPFDQGAETAGVEVPGFEFRWVTALSALVLMVGGIYTAYSAWLREGQRDPAAELGAVGAVAADGFRVDVLYDALFVRPTYAMSRLVVAGDRYVIHPYVLAAGRAFRALGALPHAAQSGRVQSYVTALLAFVVILAVTGAVVALV